MKKRRFLLGTVLGSMIITASVVSCNQKKAKTQITEELAINSKGSEVLLNLFSIKTQEIWKIKVPETNVFCELRKYTPPDTLRNDFFSCIVSGEYTDGEERGTLSLCYEYLTTYDKIEDGICTFVAPFVVNNQGSGAFYYLGFFEINTKSGLVSQTNPSLFLGDRIKFEEIIAKGKQLKLTYFDHETTQPMTAIPIAEKIINITCGSKLKIVKIK